MNPSENIGGSSTTWEPQNFPEGQKSNGVFLFIYFVILLKHKLENKICYFGKTVFRFDCNEER